MIAPLAMRCRTWVLIFLANNQTIWFCKKEQRHGWKGVKVMGVCKSGRGRRLWLKGCKRGEGTCLEKVQKAGERRISSNIQTLTIRSKTHMLEYTTLDWPVCA